MPASKPKTPARWKLEEAVAALEKIYGRPQKARITDPFQLVVWENAGYLIDDTRRTEVFRSLRERVGLTPSAILNAPDEVLIDAIREGGMRPPDRAAKLRRCAEIAEEIGLGLLRKLVRSDPAASRKLLKRFPGIGDPGADKILLCNGSLVTLAPDANVLRVLVRIGFGKREKDYSRTYRSASQATSAELPANFAWLVRARNLLRRHGQEICRRNGPRCEACPLSKRCTAFRTKSFAFF
ncbi:MAG: endonuclease III domain-containing protein [Thermoanaerobaculia bacterium]